MQDIAENDRKPFPSAKYLIAHMIRRWDHEGRDILFPVERDKNDLTFILSKLAYQVNSSLSSLLPAKLPPQFAPTFQADSFATFIFSIGLGHFKVVCTDYAGSLTVRASWIITAAKQIFPARKLRTPFQEE